MNESRVSEMCRFITRLAIIALLTLAPTALAQPDEPTPHAQREARELRLAELNQRAMTAFSRRDYMAAEHVLREMLRLEDSNFVTWYNLACALSLQDKGAEAADALVEAVEHGFCDIGQLQRDPDLSAARAHPAYKQIVDNWSAILKAQGEANLEIARKLYGPSYHYETDDTLRLAYASAFDVGSFTQARTEIEKLAAWAIDTIFPDLAEDGPHGPDPWVVVILPTREDFLKWAVSKYGGDAISGFRMIGGEYSHDSKRLISIDLGGTLRHEFLHVLHWRSATRLGQSHPVWIQEGLCSLVEDYDVVAGGGIRPMPSWRTNMARRLARGTNFIDLQELATMPRERFTGRNPLANYALARTFFLYLSDRGKLGAWYKNYTESYAHDPTGVMAIETTFGQSVGEVSREWRAWVRTLPEVAEPERPGAAVLGFEVEAETGEGLRIMQTPRAAARNAGLRRGDIITAINGRPTRDINELHRVLADYNPGDTVEVAYRRRAEHGVVQIQLARR